MDTSQFISALLAIVVIDVVLAGDNAIVIALAARALPERMQRRAIVWGAIGAIGVRSVMTAAVVWLLGLPGLLLAGGLLLLWIAYRLLVSAPDRDDGLQRPAASTFWGAMRTIVVADAVMGLDNVLAVAGAAHGSYALVLAGLLISVPLVMWGSTMVLKVIRRWPGVVYLGAGVLVWTAVRMITGEALLKPGLEAAPALGVLAYLAIPLLLWAGFVRNHRRLESRIRARLAEFGAGPRPHRGADRVPTSGPQRGRASEGSSGVQRSSVMSKILVPVDGSANALGAVRLAIGEHRRGQEVEVHLLNVQPLLPRYVTRFVVRHDREAWLEERATAAMRDAAAALTQAGVRHRKHWATGSRAEEICRAADRLRADRIVMGIARKNSLTRMFEDSVTEQVLQATHVPVELVVGDAVSKWERWGLPAGVLAAGGLLLVALD